MRHVYLLRHAKSSWDDPDLADKERPLAPRGIRDARRIADHVRNANIVPDVVICSSSRRTQETLGPIKEALGGSQILVEDGVYAASERQLLERLRSLPDAVRSALLIGHNPGVQLLAMALAGSGDEGLRQRVEAKFPTAALTTLALPDGAWATLEPGSAELLGFVTPKELG